MKALVKYEKGIGKMEIREVPMPVPGPGEVLIRIEAVGICGTDLKIQNDHFIYNPPVILGHEFSGKVESLGEGVRQWSIGDPVVSEQHTRACGHCRYCLTGKRQFCHAKRSPGYLIDGAFTEYIAIPASLLHLMPAGMTFEQAAVIEPMAVAAYGILGRCGIEPEDYVVILGSGPIAMLAVQMVRAEGASRILVTGIEADEKTRFAAAMDFGAYKTVNTIHEDPVQIVMADTDGWGADVVIDLSGAPSAIVQGLEMLRRDGRFCALGLPAGDVPIPWTKAALKAIRLIFSFSSDYESWERCLSMIKLGKIRLERFTSDVYPLDQWEEAFARASSGAALKVIIKPR
jgi:L-iditol 2-dehydrogenase